MPLTGNVRALWRLARPFTCLPPAVGVATGALSGIGAEMRRHGKTFHGVVEELDLRGLADVPPRHWSHVVIFGALAAIALNVYSNALNQLCDEEIDRLAKPERPLVTQALSRGAAWAIAFSALLASLAWGLFVRPPGSRVPEFLFCALLAAILTTAYSLPPVRLKRFGLAANFAIASARGLLLKVAGWACLFAALSPFDPEPWALGAVFFLFTFGAVTTKDFSDAQADAACGVRSLPVAWGFEKAAWLAACCLSLPWLLLPALAFFGALTMPLAAAGALGGALALYGAWIGWLLVRDPARLGAERNHPAWAHMYVLMMAAQLGTAGVYLYG
ncbi:MAG: UbiA family prenyltransferase [Planctomycetota bacterium]|nr:UbiA family prenyltransferase [Planctomycetota bacterium]